MMGTSTAVCLVHVHCPRDDYVDGARSEVSTVAFTFGLTLTNHCFCVLFWPFSVVSKYPGALLSQAAQRANSELHGAELLRGNVVLFVQGYARFSAQP
jgi:hypothetical protein